RRPRGYQYSARVIDILAMLWAAAGYICSLRLKAAIPLWLPWLRKQMHIDAEIEQSLLSMSARQMDRRLQSRKKKAKKAIYGRTKPGSLLKHHIPIKTDHWDVTTPGFTEIDLVSHSGNSAAGVFAYSLNQTDILSTWVETQAVLGKSELGVIAAIDEMRQSLPFSLEGIDSDNGSEFINEQLFNYCQKNKIQFTRGRPYKKDDNAHIEQKNWTHVRKLFGWRRYDTLEIVGAMNDLYKNELRWFMNLFTPSMKLKRKARIGSRIKRIYDQPQTPLDRLIQSRKGDPQKIADLVKLRNSVNPFDLSKNIETKMEQIQKLVTEQDLQRRLLSTNNVVKNRRPGWKNNKCLFEKKGWHSIGSMIPKNSKKLTSLAKAKEQKKYNLG
ncbi:transposase family protein, partial [bacterium]|nr:transposase family protein [bacterium]